MVYKSESSLVIRPYGAGDKAQLYRLLAEIWPERSAELLDRRWWWSLDEPTLYVAEEADGSFAGLCGFLPFDLRADGAVRRGAWIVDYFVLRSRQGKGIGKRLVAAIGERFDFLASLNQTDAAWAAFERSGWRPRAFVPLLLSPSSRLSRLLSWRPSGSATRVTRTEARFGDDFQRLWERAAPRLPPASLRDAATLRARFERSPRDYAVLRADAGGELRGYMVLRVIPAGGIRSFPRHRIALVSDYLVEPGEPGVFARLVGEASAWAAEQGVRFVLCMATDPAHRRVLAGRAFLGPDTPGLGRRLRKLAVGFTATPDAPGPHPWHLTPMDCDLDLLFDAR